MLFTFLLPVLAMELTAGTATISTSSAVPISSPAPAKNMSECTLADQAIHAIAVSRPTPSTAFTAYMDAQDPYRYNCLAPIPVNQTAYFAQAYFEEASFYNAAHATTEPLSRGCEDDIGFNQALWAGGRTWREHGLKQGLPGTWEELEKKFEVCTGREQEEEKKGEGKEEKKGKEEKEGKESKGSGAEGGMKEEGEDEEAAGEDHTDNKGARVKESTGGRMNVGMAVVVGVVAVAGSVVSF
ncbi:hypothetical protein K458DRAFT_400699 [Lentithecium fluviatile CBS 122367]|uniref:Uncharacterized protein n=1 Tax=Lentithecium fluviatile CBS 122367 TaxID=1168545 RepID=A0A6G1JDG8_9PLEO|nr:hypothetical protein K458DRAFT_400699 [Lentithecium fluviatile CBS 122367]